MALEKAAKHPDVKTLIAFISEQVLQEEPTDPAQALGMHKAIRNFKRKFSTFTAASVLDEEEEDFGEYIDFESKE